jgi:hypothetical protein
LFSWSQFLFCLYKEASPSAPGATSMPAFVSFVFKVSTLYRPAIATTLGKDSCIPYFELGDFKKNRFWVHTALSSDPHYLLPAVRP